MKWNEYLISMVKKRKQNWQRLADKMGIQYHTLYCGLYEGWLLNVYVEQLAKILKANITPYKRVLAAKSCSPMELYLMNKYTQQQAVIAVRNDAWEANSERAYKRHAALFIKKEKRNAQ